jgi:hypothetical protein
MSLQYASEELTRAVEQLATSELPLHDRLQAAWDDHVQQVWMKPCLTAELLADFRDLWHRYTAPSDDPRNTTLRELTDAEDARAIAELVDLATRTAVTAATAGPDVKLATLADLT